MKDESNRREFTRPTILQGRAGGAMSKAALRLGVASLALAALGCGQRSAAAPSRASAFTSANIGPTSPALSSSVVDSANLHVSDELAAICNVDFDDVESAPKFDFDRSDLLVEDGQVLAQIARCVTTGTLAGRSLVLVGRADPRGEAEYNMALGEQRATHVRTYLLRLGIPSAKLRSISRGKLDATGSDEAGWLRDRRVDISLR